ncbi:MAG TPA: hypothetical protein ENJ82_04310 [Bacteroidetes bacterium]|nr:hypothetical protein [Bacteroidota bacterium]
MFETGSLPVSFKLEYAEMFGSAYFPALRCATYKTRLGRHLSGAATNHFFQPSNVRSTKSPTLLISFFSLSDSGVLP